MLMLLITDELKSHTELLIILVNLNNVHCSDIFTKQQTPLMSTLNEALTRSIHRNQMKMKVPIRLLHLRKCFQNGNKTRMKKKPP